MMKKVFFIGAMAAIIGCCVGIYLFNKPVMSIVQMDTDYKLSPEMLLTSFEDNEAQANALYLDKVVEVSGIVTKYETSDGKSNVYLDTGNELSSIIFQLEQYDSNIKAGEQLTMKGICTGYLMDVVLVKAIKI